MGKKEDMKAKGEGGVNSSRESRREIPCSVIIENEGIPGTATHIIQQWHPIMVFRDFYGEVMSVFLTLWTGSEVSSTTSSVLVGGSST